MGKKRDDEGMKSRLMKAAMSAFTKKGLDGCTMGDIAGEAGLAQGTAYLYFRGKEELMLFMYKHYAAQNLKYQEKVLAKAEQAGADCRTLLRELCTECLKAARRHKRTFSIWFQFLALSSSKRLRNRIREMLAENYRGHNRLIESLIERGVSEGQFKAGTDKRAISAALISLLEGLLIREFADTELIDLDQDYPKLVDLLLDGIVA